LTGTMAQSLSQKRLQTMVKWFGRGRSDVWIMWSSWRARPRAMREAMDQHDGDQQRRKETDARGCGGGVQTRSDWCAARLRPRRTVCGTLPCGGPAPASDIRACHRGHHGFRTATTSLSDGPRRAVCTSTGAGRPAPCAATARPAGRARRTSEIRGRPWNVCCVYRDSVQKNNLDSYILVSVMLEI